MSDAPLPSRTSNSAVRRAAAFLERQGFAPRCVTSEKRFPFIVFDVDGDSFNVVLDERDPDFWQLNLGYRLPRPSDLSESELLRIAHDTQATAKLVKVFIGRDAAFVEFQVHMWLGRRRMTRDLLDRCMKLLHAIAKEFHDRLLLQRPAAEA